MMRAVENIMQASFSSGDDKPVHRLSISLTAEQHRELMEIARKNRVSIAWVAREAIDRLLKDEAPLLRVVQK
jgi:ribosome maturation protein Sdo1